MEPVSVILAALAAGAAKPAGQVAQDAYEGLKALIKRKFEAANQSLESSLVDEYEKNPEATAALLKSKLEAAALDKDTEIQQQAETVRQGLNTEELGRFNLTVGGDFKGIAANTISGGDFKLDIS